jgi:hypothetical protein
MIANLAGSVIAASCLGCGPEDGKGVLQLSYAPAQSDAEQTRDAIDLAQPSAPDDQFRLPLRLGSDFGPAQFAGEGDAGRFRALDLSVPMPIRQEEGEVFGGEFAFGASGERTGLGVDVQVAPRARVERDRGGADTTRAGAEVRLGQNLTDRDQRGTDIAAPSWYFFVGADGEALVWNVADRRSMSGVALRDQATVGDLQAGVAMSRGGGQMSLGLVERRTSFNDIAGDRDVETKEHFAAFSYTLRR